MRRLSCLVVAAVGMLSASFATRASMITIDFNNLSGANDSVFNSYTESGFMVTSSEGYYVAQGVNGTIGDPAPDIFTTDTGTLTITDGGKPFSLDGIDLGSFRTGSISFTVTGLDGSENVLSTNAYAVEGREGAFLPITGFSSTPLTSLTITIDGGSVEGADIDNIALSPVSSSPMPESSSFLMLGTDLLGVVGAMRKRFA